MIDESEVDREVESFLEKRTWNGHHIYLELYPLCPSQLRHLQEQPMQISIIPNHDDDVPAVLGKRIFG